MVFFCLNKKGLIEKKLFLNTVLKIFSFNEKYINTPFSAGFACIYVPSESLYHEITTHINQKKIFISNYTVMKKK